MIKFYTGKPGKAARLVTKPHGLRHLIALSAFDQLDDLYGESPIEKASVAFPQTSQGELSVKKFSKIAAAMAFAGLVSIAYAGQGAAPSTLVYAEAQAASDRSILTQDLVARTLAHAEARAAADQNGPQLVVDPAKEPEYEQVGSFKLSCSEWSDSISEGNDGVHVVAKALRSKTCKVFKEKGQPLPFVVIN
jgi:hypothetical protein